jgi:hypothetical protein
MEEVRKRLVKGKCESRVAWPDSET